MFKCFFRRKKKVESKRRLQEFCFKILSVLIIGNSHLAHASTTTIGNGGDSVKCVPSSSNAFRGLYSLDYLLTYSDSSKNADIVQVFDWDASFARLSQILKKFPDLEYSFQNFVQDLGNLTDPTRPKIWHESAFGLVDIKDERIIRKVPPNCYKQKDDLAIDVMQTVVRTERSDATIYEFDPQILSEFLKFAPLQYSFLLVHEWLWDLTQDVQIIRDINRFLHSEAAQKLNEEQFRLAILRLGLDFRVKEFFNVCQRTLEIREQIVASTSISCEDIKQADMFYDFKARQNGVNTISIEGKNIPDFKIGDFSGITELKKLTLSNIGLRHLYESQFETASLIQNLILDHNDLASIPGQIFKKLKNLGTVNLSYNKLSKIPEGMFLPNDNQNYKQSLDLSNNLIVSLDYFPPNGTKIVPFFQMDFSNSLITDIPQNFCDFVPSSYFKVKLNYNPLSDTAKAKIKALPCAKEILIN